MKYLCIRSNTYYYRRRLPKELASKLNINIIYRSLSTDKKTAIQIAKRYDTLFILLDTYLKLGNDISDILQSLDLAERTTKPDKPIDPYTMYIDSQNVSPNRLSKINRLLSTLKVLLPEVTTINMTKLDRVKSDLMRLPKGNIQKYKSISKAKLIHMNIPTDERLTNETVNDYIKTLNSLLKFAYERDIIDKQYQVKTLSATATARDQREAFSENTIITLLEQATSAKLASAYKLLYLSGMRPSEAYKCRVSIVDGIECFDLTDKSIPLKTKSSYRLIPVHKSITDPHKLLEDLRSYKIQNLGRQFKKDTNGGLLYSLRHSFATNLSKSVEPHLISELMGHAHEGMTLNRYVKGFDVKVLKDAVNQL